MPVNDVHCHLFSPHFLEALARDAQAGTTPTP
jgi:hypothetical protein